jgi:thiol-disulfide isomerase/thioredoxin
MNRRQQLGALAAVGSLAVGAGAGWWQYSTKRVDSSEKPADTSIWNQELPTPQGQTLRLIDHRGRWMLLNFWATWCPPCIREMPLLEAFYKENAAKGWQVVGIAADQAEAVNAYLMRQPVSYPIALAGFAGIEMSRQLGNLAGGLPFTVVFDPHGELVHRHVGELKSDLLDR